MHFSMTIVLFHSMRYHFCFIYASYIHNLEMKVVCIANRQEIVYNQSNLTFNHLFYYLVKNKKNHLN